MTAFTVGARVRITAPSYPNCTGIVTDPANGNTELTVTVLVDAREYVTAHETYFAPDELELIHDDTASVRPEPLPYAGEWQGDQSWCVKGTETHSRLASSLSTTDASLSMPTASGATVATQPTT